MDLILRNDLIEIDGYVNAIERLSNPIRARSGTFRERIKKGAFKSSLRARPDVALLLNHREDKRLGGTLEGNSLELREDNIGLHAHAVVRDRETVEKGHEGKLVGWSFGFIYGDRVDEHEERGEPVKDVYDLDLFEVSLLDDTRRPAYDGTLVNVRDDETRLFGDDVIEEFNVRDERIPDPEPEPEKEIDYSAFENILKKMKGETTT